MGGGVTGFLVSILVLKNFETRQWKKNFQIICVAILAILSVIIIFVNIFGGNSYFPTEWNTKYGDSHDNFVYQCAIASPEPSAEREYCKQFTKCRLLLNKFNASSLNVTIELKTETKVVL